MIQVFQSFCFCVHRQNNMVTLESESPSNNSIHPLVMERNRHFLLWLRNHRTKSGWLVTLYKFLLERYWNKLLENCNFPHHFCFTLIVVQLQIYGLQHYISLAGSLIFIPLIMVPAMGGTDVSISFVTYDVLHNVKGGKVVVLC